MINRLMIVPKMRSSHVFPDKKLIHRALVVKVGRLDVMHYLFSRLLISQVTVYFMMP